MPRHALAGAAWPALAELSVTALPEMPATTNGTEHAGVVGADAEAEPRGRDVRRRAGTRSPRSAVTSCRVPRRGLGPLVGT